MQKQQASVSGDMNDGVLTIIDYGLGNLLSVRRGFEHCGANVIVTSDPDAILKSTHVVLPGVGAFAVGIGELRRQHLDDVVRQVAMRGTPLLGICLGMQLLFDEGEEFGVKAGLGLIPGRVIPLPVADKEGVPLKIPHIGWSELFPSDSSANWHGSLLEGVCPGDAVYFVHSFMAEPAIRSHCICDCLYGGKRIVATVCRDNIYGCQFHPEKSGAIGLRILKKFLSI